MTRSDSKRPPGQKQYKSEGMEDSSFSFVVFHSAAGSSAVACPLTRETTFSHRSLVTGLFQRACSILDTLVTCDPPSSVEPNSDCFMCLLKELLHPSGGQ
ncbi:hypothetical protein EOD39_21766 [Acipenser ruthenus]|uniref:Uncharacterized protein n=1 Tax=Acipenser ruthenus TaxID=7906 RepID=A0A444URU2_ACIRT|nr:hypothetical protein EOD39_21766 [Acipenser ruthenus]